MGQRTERGYTEHEHLDEVGIIHMNGRVYDPLMGRFMSADPNVFHPENMKDFNRYSYVWNNPLKMWDPTGFLADGPSGNDTYYRSPASHSFSDSVTRAIDSDGGLSSWTWNNPNGPMPTPSGGNGSSGSSSGGGLGTAGGLVIKAATFYPGPVGATASAAESAEYFLNDNIQDGVISAFSAAIGMFFDAGLAKTGLKKALGWVGLGEKAAVKESVEALAAKGAEQAAIQFGKVENQVSHTFRHVEKAGFDRQVVQDAIKQDLSQGGQIFV